VDLLHDLLSAFEQDVAKTRDGAGYADRAELMEYCRRSANPVGRLMLHLYGVNGAAALRQSDCICTALQLINFWQDLSVDIPRGRYYLPADDCRRYGLEPLEPKSWGPHADASRLVAAEVEWARALMTEGAPLVHRIPGRAGWELRLVVQGGLRILDKIARGGFDSLRARPRLAASDAPLLFWRAVWM
jgi:hydroxysqualene synthase